MTLRGVGTVFSVPVGWRPDGRIKHDRSALRLRSHLFPPCHPVTTAAGGFQPNRRALYSTESTGAGFLRARARALCIYLSFREPRSLPPHYFRLYVDMNLLVRTPFTRVVPPLPTRLSCADTADYLIRIVVATKPPVLTADTSAGRIEPVA